MKNDPFYLDNNATAPFNPQVVHATPSLLTKHFGNLRAHMGTAVS